MDAVVKADTGRGIENLFRPRDVVQLPFKFVLTHLERQLLVAQLLYFSEQVLRGKNVTHVQGENGGKGQDDDHETRRGDGSEPVVDFRPGILLDDMRIRQVAP